MCCSLAVEGVEVVVAEWMCPLHFPHGLDWQMHRFLLLWRHANPPLPRVVRAWWRCLHLPSFGSWWFPVSPTHGFSSLNYTAAEWPHPSLSISVAVCVLVNWYLCRLPVCEGGETETEEVRIVESTNLNKYSSYKVSIFGKSTCWLLSSNTFDYVEYLLPLLQLYG